MACTADQEQGKVAAAVPSVGGVCPPPGLPPPRGLPSHGSRLHGTGECKPCVWFWKRTGCEHGEDCGHCHLCPRSEISDRRRRRRQVVKELKQVQQQPQAEA